jgi:transcription elongation factor Elf1
MKRPDTTTATIVCTHCGRPTKHNFTGAQPPANGDTAYVDFIFACRTCKTSRVWGNQMLYPSLLDAQ